MTLVSAVVSEARRQFMTSQRDRYNTLSAPISTVSATTISTTFDISVAGTAVTAGTVIEIDLEIMLTVAVTAPSSLTVIRGFLGSTPATHATGALVKVNPVLFDLDLFQGIVYELRALSSPLNGLFRIASKEIQAGGQIGYDLAPAQGSPILEIGRIEWQEPQGYWREVTDWRLERNANIADFPSGYGIVFKGIVPSGRTMRVLYKTDFGNVTSQLDDLEATAGLPAECVDIVMMGAAIRAANPREIGRNFHERQPDTRRPTEVPPGAQLQAPGALRAMYAARVTQERSRLNIQWKQFDSIWRSS